MTNVSTHAARFAAATTRPNARTGLFARLARWLETHRALHDVHALDDRMLRDIGLTRGQIESAVRGDR